MNKILLKFKEKVILYIFNQCKGYLMNKGNLIFLLASSLSIVAMDKPDSTASIERKFFPDSIMPIFECNKCEKCYLKKSSLDIHKARNHRKKKFACIICSYRSALQGDLAQHIRRTHE